MSDINTVVSTKEIQSKQNCALQDERIFSKAITQFCQLEEKHLVGVLFETKASEHEQLIT